MNPKSKKTVQDTLTLEYDLYSLPTAQHKAGLVGLLLMIESMKRREMSPLPNYEFDDSMVKISFTKDSWDLVLQDLYEGEIITRDNEKEKYAPKLAYLSSFGINDIWIKTWSKCIRTVIRKGNALGIFMRGYKKIIKDYKLLLIDCEKTEKPDASLVIAEEAENAERIEIKGTRKNNYLLHFSLLPSFLYIPKFLRQLPNKLWIRDFHMSQKRRGPFFVIVIPEPSNIRNFYYDCINLLQRLDDTSYKHALIDIPQEGGLEYLCQLTSQRVEQQELQFSVASVEIHYLEKQGNNIRKHTSDRIVP
ncbi:MAG TPA: hypothetical protein PLX83_21305, partial [bacterium]|nr:hypothetical protein [bacterium]